MNEQMEDERELWVMKKASDEMKMMGFLFGKP